MRQRRNSKCTKSEILKTHQRRFECMCAPNSMKFTQCSLLDLMHFQRNDGFDNFVCFDKKKRINLKVLKCEKVEFD